jgi:ribulose-phosphate 3-epimerase
MVIKHIMGNNSFIKKKILKDNIIEKLNFSIYKAKHLIIYIIIGIVSLLIELTLRKLLLIYFNHSIINYVCLMIGISTAFILNIKFNFNIQKKYFYRSLIYFFLISIFSFLIQDFLKSLFLFENLTYIQKRFIISSFVFIFAYVLHLKFSFRSSIKVGVAIYANGIEDISNIYNKIGKYPDFIHVDIVDETFVNDNQSPKTHKLEVVKAYWPNHEIHLHLMSKYPSRYIDEAIKYSDIIYVHYEIHEDINVIMNKIQNAKKRNGIVLHAVNNYENLRDIIKISNDILVLSIEKPGFSGQNFMNQANSLINKIINLKNKTKINLCIDGGINRQNISKISADYIVSGSAVLKSEKPIREIMVMQTFSRYEK